MPHPGLPAAPQADWLSPPSDQHTLRRYLTTIVDRWWLVVLCTVVCAGAAFAYAKLADPVYEASADLLITPVSGGDETFVGLGLIQDSNDPTRDVSTAARYVASIPVAVRVREALGAPEPARELLDAISAEPVAQSSIVTITAEAPTALRAARLANAFATQAVQLRTEQLHEQVGRTIAALRERLRSLGGDASGDDAAAGLRDRLGSLEALRGVPDPTMRLLTRASVPERPASPRPLRSLAAGLFAGLLLGVGGAFALQAFDPRLRREEQVRELFRLPILARIPVEPRAKRNGVLPTAQLSPSTVEAYRTLRASLAGTRGETQPGRSILVTGSCPAEGKTTTAINLAHALASAGNSVILIDADVYRPQVGAALGLHARYGLAAALIGQVPLEDALVTSPDYGPDVQVLLVDRPGPGTADRLSLPTARQLVHDAEQLADYVVIDAPPITEVADVLPLVQEATDVLVLARPRRTKLSKLRELGEILARNGVRPVGVALVGVDRSSATTYYTAAEPTAAGHPVLPT
jgi:Mrp family chromosome partitioning ATPase/capsular polysaccharide biosynthesis protein